MTPKDYHLDKFHIISSTESIVEEIQRSCKNVSTDSFFHSSEKWSIAEQIEHLRLCFHNSWMGMRIPKFISKRVFGKPTHSSLPYEELQEKYELEVYRGAKATKPYIPSPDVTKMSKEQLLNRFQLTVTNYLNEIKYYWEDENMDKYQFPHPILGKITARELMYFNIFHCWHHFKIIRHLNGQAFDL